MSRNSSYSTIFAFQCGLGPSILVLGDGNLSFSLSLAKLHPDKEICATVLEDESEWLEKYGESGGASLLKKIRCATNIKPMFGVNATDFANTCFQRCQFTDIIFNFPHQGGKTNLKKSKTLLRQVLLTVSTNLMSRGDDTRLHITLASGQSGLDPTTVSEQRYFGNEPPMHNKDSWQPLEIGADLGLVAKTVKQFCAELFPEYSASGYKNRDREFNNQGQAHTICFTWNGHNKSAKIRLKTAKIMEICGQKSRKAPYFEVREPIFHQFRPIFEYHISIIYLPSHQMRYEQYAARLQNEVIRFMHQFYGPFLIRVKEMKEKRCFDMKRNPNRIYLVQLQGIAIPLYKELANALNDDVCLRMKSTLKALNCEINLVTVPHEQ